MGNFNVIAIDNFDEMGHLVTILTNNGYEVQVKPVYETLEDLKKDGRYVSRRTRPCVKYFQVEIIGIVPTPVYVED